MVVEVLLPTPRHGVSWHYYAGRSSTVGMVVIHQLPYVAWARSRHHGLRLGARYSEVMSWCRCTGRAVVHRGLPTPLVATALPRALAVVSGALDPVGLVGANSGSLAPFHSGYDPMPIHRIRRDLDGAEPHGVT